MLWSTDILRLFAVGMTGYTISGVSRNTFMFSIHGSLIVAVRTAITCCLIYGMTGRALSVRPMMIEREGMPNGWRHEGGRRVTIRTLARYMCGRGCMTTLAIG